MSKPTSASIVASKPLTDMSIALMNAPADYIAARIQPTPVKQRKGTYYVYSQADLNRLILKERQSGTEAAADGFALATEAYELKNYGGKVPLDVDDIEDADEVLDLSKDAVEMLANAGAMQVESDLATCVGTLATWGAGTDLVGVASSPSTDQFLGWEVAGSTPAGDVLVEANGIKTRGNRRPNTIISGGDVAAKLRAHPDFVGRFQYTREAPSSSLMEKELAAYFAVDNFHILDASYNSANEGLSATMAQFMSNKLWLGYVAPTPGRKTASAFKRFVWASPAGGGSDGVRVRVYMDESIKSEVTELDAFFQFKRVAVSLGRLFTNCISR